VSNKNAIVLRDTMIYFLKKKDEKHSDLVEKFNTVVKRFNNLSDSTQTLASFYKAIKEKYGIELELVKNDSINGYEFKMSPADSGLVLLKYYRNCLEYDSVKHTWTVTIKK
jgi:hypothetical protein